MGGAVAMQAPPQAPVAGQIIVGVHVELAGQPVVALTVHGISGGIVCEVTQRPPQVTVGVQVEPPGQRSPPNVQVFVKIGPVVGKGEGEPWYCASASGRTYNSSIGFIFIGRTIKSREIVFQNNRQLLPER